jgi:hypothetical protein
MPARDWQKKPPEFAGEYLVNSIRYFRELA